MTTTLLAIPQPSQLVDVLTMCQSIEAQLPYVDDVAVLKDGAAKLRAIDEYVALTSSEGRGALAATIQRIQIRVGEVLGDAEHYHGNQFDQRVSVATETLSKDERREFRLMAAHSDIAEAQIATSTDQNPVSRAQILRAIDRFKAAQQRQEAEDAELAQFMNELGPAKDPEGDKKRQGIRMAVIGVLTATEALAKFSADDLAWAINTSPKHVADTVRNNLAQAINNLEGVMTWK